MAMSKEAKREYYRNKRKNDPVYRQKQIDRCSVWAKENKEKRNRSLRARHLRIKIECFQHYGNGECFCCGETILEFLALDHVNNDGTKHRKEKGVGGAALMALLKAEGWPAGFQVACHNCNIGRYLNGGVCPHGRK
jgi:hypothetical protein